MKIETDLLQPKFECKGKMLDFLHIGLNIKFSMETYYNFLNLLQYK